MKNNKSEHRLVGQYLNEVSKAVVCKKSTKKYLLKELECSVSSYCEEHPDALIGDLYSEFGKPEDYTFSVNSREDCTELYRKAKKKTVLLMIVSILSVLTIAALVFLVIYVIKVYGGSHITVSNTY